MALVVSGEEKTEEKQEEKSDQSTTEAADTPEDIVKKFKEQIEELRKDQFERIKIIASLQLEDDRKTYVQYLFNTSVKGFTELKKAVDEAGYTSDMPLPMDKNLTGAIAVIFENTLFISEIAARIFKVTRDLISENPEYSDSFKWAVEFCQKSKSLLSESDKNILDVAAKEFSIVPREASYQNPFIGWQEEVFDNQPKYRYKDFKKEQQRKEEL
ncbi:expressed hypothetical protein [Trichoplax adhaerens]|uniref:Coiled-coil domain-containing protein n=1 Tax=Trichoplax adhaerens TaxID=10228 RepID=B3S9U3_TRIAD|nr:expressed hypothetical protein [Trichoplax adhaerens]EDV20532.1 expressed hypothetical protein [Trichoplax adhaerens]|eukprot:XP_002116958.1 expressed hypothetical protein [Trichoplax adhaerens]